MPFPSLLHPSHPAGFMNHRHSHSPPNQQQPTQLSSPPLTNDTLPQAQAQAAAQQQAQQQGLPSRLQYRPLRFVAQILSPYDYAALQQQQPGAPYPLQQTQSAPSPPSGNSPYHHNFPRLHRHHAAPTTPQPNAQQQQHHQRPLAPDFDVRESEHAYFLEGEFPGVRDKESVRLEWVDCRTLAIEARVHRISLDEEWGELIQIHNGTNNTTTIPSVPIPELHASNIAGGMGGIKKEADVHVTEIDLDRDSADEHARGGSDSVISDHDSGHGGDIGDDMIDTDAATIHMDMDSAPMVDGGPICREAEIEQRKRQDEAERKMAEMRRLQQHMQHMQQRQQKQLKLDSGAGTGLVKPFIKEWLSERRVGHYQRTFTFPADVDARGVRARLGQGLLRILVPKLRDRSLVVRKVEVECVE